MAQINLLSSNNQSHNLFSSFGVIIVRVLFVLVAFVLAYSGYLWYSGKKTSQAITAVQQRIAQDEAAILQDKDRSELLTRQGQLKEFENLSKQHLYWSNLFAELPKVILKQASVVSISLFEDGTATMVVAVPTYNDMDKFLQVFDLPDYNRNFSDVRVQSISKIQKDSSLEIRFKINSNLTVLS